MAKRVCNVPGCPTICDGPRCDQHARPGTTARGYGSAHQRESREWRDKVRGGELVICWRCNEPITDPDDCHLGHDDHDRSITRGPEHGRRCNLSTAGRISQMR
jgi:hypothetical protein